jgi:hypothetical protein
MLTALGLLVAGAALLLLWAGVKGKSPLDALRNAATGKATVPR